MTDSLAFLAAIDADRRDFNRRLIYADWLDDHDRPDDARRQRLLACLYAVHADPDSDEPRLQYAGLLDRGAGVACPECEGRKTVVERYRAYESDDHCTSTFACPACRGTGRVPDALAARAEFIRVQCELARLTPPGTVCYCTFSAHNRSSTCGYCRQAEPLRQRAWDMVRDHGHAWMRAYFGGSLRETSFSGPDPAVTVRFADGTGTGAIASARVTFGRGFPATVRGPLDALWRVCETCGGQKRVDYEGGNGRVFTADCPACAGRGHAGALAALGPEVLALREVVVTDPEPHVFRLPSKVYDRLPDDGLGSDGRSLRGFNILELARQALSRAVLKAACEPWLGGEKKRG